MEKNIGSVKLVDEIRIVNRLVKCNYSQIAAIDDAIEYGARGAEEFADAISLFADNMYELKNKMAAICESLQTEKESKVIWEE